MRVGLLRHKGTEYMENPYSGSSLTHAWNSVEHLIRAIGDEPVLVPSTVVVDDSWEAAIDDLLRHSDVLLCPPGGLELVVRRREELHLAPQIVADMLGDLPKGAPALWASAQYLRSYDRVVYHSLPDKDILATLLDSTKFGHAYIPRGIDSNAFQPTSGRQKLRIRRALGIGDNQPVVLYMGSVNISKNVHSILNVMRWLKARLPEVLFVFVGQGSDVPLEEFGVTPDHYWLLLMFAIQTLGLEDSARFVGQVARRELADWYHIADVLINLTLLQSENFGQAQVEAALCEVPVVGSSWGGLQDVVADGLSGYLAPVDLTSRGPRVDWHYAAHCCLRMLRDPNLRGELAVGVTPPRERSHPPMPSP